MKRDNKVILDGFLTPIKIYPAVGTTALRCEIKTSASIGGEHPVLIYGLPSVETLSFMVAAKIEEISMEVTVQGWLWSNHNSSTTVVENISFHCSSSVRSAAKNILSQVSKGSDSVELHGKSYSFKTLIGHLYEYDESDDMYLSQISSQKGSIN